MTSGTNATGELGAFLRALRSRITPTDLGMPSYGARRVPGLRREELAQLAGVSATYYTRLEQGQSTNASAAVLDALARALDLDEDEQAHLHDLAHPVRPRRRRPGRPETVSAGIARLIGTMTDVPAVVVGRRTDVLAWNQLGHALLAPHLGFAAVDAASTRPNLTRLLFLDCHSRDLYPRWDDEARRAVASLRLIAGRHPDDPALAELVGDLCIHSPEFASLWAGHPVLTCTSGIKQRQHPRVGPMELAFEVLHLPGGSGQRLMTYTAEPHSPSDLALSYLHDSAPDRASR